jgi:ubiquinone/menaquinone biosynthesis C-methylase UbiE
MSGVARLDYDRTSLPAEYDRGRSFSLEQLSLWLHALEERLPGATPRRILDLGCGTGRFTEALAAHFSAEVIGLDPSLQMLQRARDKRQDARVEYLRGTAEAIPLPAGSVDLVFMSMCFHHFADKRQAATECRRVLREGGAAALRNGTRERIGEYPYVPFFPSSRAILEQVLPDHDELRRTFEAAGFGVAASAAIRHVVCPGWDAYADRLAAGGDSVLARLDAAELSAGLAAIRARASQYPGQAVEESIDLFVFQ